MSCVNIRGCCIGEGRPKVIIPIVEPTETAVLEKAAEFSTLRADCVEWRIDCFEGAKDFPAIVHCAAKLRVALKDQLLLFTFRTKAEGGKVALAHEEYLHFIRTVLATDCADLIDIEFFTAGAELPALIEEAHTAGAAVVCSSHDFAKTPPRAELVSRMVQMQQAGADLPKLAVMPHTPADTARLLEATAQAAAATGNDTPLITMSMGQQGMVSRICGAAFGSCAGFATAGVSSAPGQPAAPALRTALDALGAMLG